MTQKPKQWGAVPSPEGLGKLRTAVETTAGLPFVRVSGPGFEAAKANLFQHVAALPPPQPSVAVQELMFAGNNAPNGVYKRRGAPLTKAYKPLPFTPAVGVIEPPVNYRWVRGMETTFGSVVYEDYPYIDHLGNARTATMARAGRTIRTFLARRFGHGVEVSPDWVTELVRTNITEVTYSGAMSVTLGCHFGDPYRLGCFVVFPTRDGGVSSYGVPTVSLKAAVMQSIGGVMSTATVSLPRPPTQGYGGTNIVPIASAVLRPGSAVVMAVELPPDVRALGDGPHTFLDDTRVLFDNSGLRIWVYKTTDWGATWSYSECTALQATTPAYDPVLDTLGTPFANRTVYAAVYPGEGAPPVLYQGGPQVTGSTNQRYVGEALLASQAVAVTPSILLLLGYIVDHRMYPAYDDPVEYRSFVIRSTDGGTSWTSVATPFSAAVTSQPIPAEIEKPPIFHPCVIGAGVVFCRISLGLYASEDRELRFMRSVDAGATWVEVSPAGLPAANSRQLGEFFTLPTLSGPPKLCVTAWDGAAYRMYASYDQGNTFEAERKVFTPAAFAGMDVGGIHEDNVETGNFGYATYIPVDVTDPVDPGAPWSVDSRYPPP